MYERSERDDFARAERSPNSHHRRSSGDIYGDEHSKRALVCERAPVAVGVKVKVEGVVKSCVGIGFKRRIEGAARCGCVVGFLERERDQPHVGCASMGSRVREKM